MKARINMSKTKEPETNMFIEMIKENCSANSNWFKKLQKRIAYKKFISKLNKTSPDFVTLWHMCNFIKYAEVLFFYDNSLDQREVGLYSSHDYPEGENGLRIFDDKYTITIKLYRASRQVVTLVERLNGNKTKSKMDFTDGQWNQDPDMYEEILLEVVVQILVERVIKLFSKCYWSY